MRVLLHRRQILRNLLGSAKLRSALLAFSCFAEKRANVQPQHCQLLKLEFEEENKTLEIQRQCCLIKDDTIKDFRVGRTKRLMSTREALPPMPFRIQSVPGHRRIFHQCNFLTICISFLKSRLGFFASGLKQPPSRALCY